MHRCRSSCSRPAPSQAAWGISAFCSPMLCLCNSRAKLFLPPRWTRACQTHHLDTWPLAVRTPELAEEDTGTEVGRNASCTVSPHCTLRRAATWLLVCKVSRVTVQSRHKGYQKLPPRRKNSQKHQTIALVWHWKDHAGGWQPLCATGLAVRTLAEAGDSQGGTDHSLDALRKGDSQQWSLLILSALILTFFVVSFLSGWYLFSGKGNYLK